MRTTKQLPSVLAVVVGCFFAGLGQSAAAPGLGGQAGTVSGGGTAASSGGHSSSSPASARPASSGDAVPASGAGPSRFSSTAVGSGAPHYSPGGFQPNASAAMPTRGRSGSAFVSHPVVATQQDASASQEPRSFTPAQPRNAWTDVPTANTRITGLRARADLYNRSAGAYRNYISSGNYVGLTTPEGFTGSVLYPGAYGSALNSYYDALGPNGALVGSRQATNYARIQRWYGRDGRRYRYWPNGYSPYFGVSSYPFFGGYSSGDTLDGAYNGDSGVSTNPPLSNVDQSVAVMNKDLALQDAGSPAPAASNKEMQPGTLGTGPDSLIEAVQGELARRGYFPGKVDAIYGATTKDALRHFQADRKLTVTGRVNEATLHALELD